MQEFSRKWKSQVPAAVKQHLESQVGVFIHRVYSGNKQAQILSNVNQTRNFCSNKKSYLDNDLTELQQHIREYSQYSPVHNACEDIDVLDRCCFTTIDSNNPLNMTVSKSRRKAAG